jgi:hypothetical protein
MGVEHHAPVELDTGNPEDQAKADAAALARSEGDLLEPPAEADPKARPDWCPEKFARFNDDGTFNASESATALSGAHSSLETQFTQKQQGQEPADEPKDEPKDEPADDNAPEPLTDAEFWNSLTDEYNESGELSAESRTILRDIGIPDQMVDDFIAGQSARGDAYHNQVTSVLGDNGAAEYDALVDWAGENMTEEQANVFNDAVGSGDVTRAQVAIRDLKSLYVTANGSFGGLLGGSAPGNAPSGVTPFMSRHEQSTAINDPRYTRDSAYRELVEKRMEASNL